MVARPPVERTHFISGAEPRDVLDVVVDLEAYPRLFPEIKSARILERESHRARVEFCAHVVLAVRYVIDVRCNTDPPMVDWTFVEGEIVTDSMGSWRFVPERGGTRLEYKASLEIRAPLPAFLVRKATDALVSASLPGMFSAIEREVVRRRESADPLPPTVICAKTRT